MTIAGVCPECGSQIPDDAPEGNCPKCLLKLAFEADSDATPEQVPAAPAEQPTGCVAPEPHELADQFPQLEILELIGRGGMGVVYKARQRHLDRIVALKILSTEISQDPTLTERFTREARAMAKLVHPNIALVFDFGQADGVPYLVMEFIDGVNLRHSIQAGGLKPEEVLAIVPQICDALGYAHDMGVIHRDIKPENILLDYNGTVKIADFGLAKLLDHSTTYLTLSGSRHVLGTPAYMSPEQLESPLSVDHRADIYALGVVFYEMLTGELPMGRFAPPSSKADVDSRLDDVVHKCLEKEPDRRYQHTTQLKNDIVSITTHVEQLVERVARGGAAVLRAAWHDLMTKGFRRLPHFCGTVIRHVPQFVKAGLYEFPQLLRIPLFLFYVLFLCTFFSIGGTDHQNYAQNEKYYSHTIGGGQPWYRMDYWDSKGYDVSIRFDSESWVYLLGGMLCYYLYWRLKPPDEEPRPRFRFPGFHIIFWTLVALWTILTGFHHPIHDEMMKLPSIDLHF